MSDKFDLWGSPLRLIKVPTAVKKVAPRLEGSAAVAASIGKVIKFVEIKNDILILNFYDNTVLTAEDTAVNCCDTNWWDDSNTCEHDRCSEKCIQCKTVVLIGD